MKKGKKLFYYFLMLLPICTCSCQNDMEQDELTERGVNVLTNVCSTTKIDGTSLPSGSIIGVSVTNSSGGDYNGKTTGYKNIPYTADGTGSSQRWSTTTPIMLSATAARAYAYYPYSSDYINPNSISINNASQTDYLYSGIVSGLSFKYNDASFQLKHVMTCIRLMLKKGNYSASGNISSVSFKSTSLATSAILNAETGSVTNITGTGEYKTWTGTPLFTISPTYKTLNWLCIPTTTISSLYANIVVDGSTYTVTIPMSVQFQAGNIHNFYLTLNDKEITVTSVSIKDWTSSTNGELTFSPA